MTRHDDDVCARCPVGQAAGTRGEDCPFVGRPRRRGDYICVEDEPATQVWFVKRGAVVLTRQQHPAASAVDPAGATHATAVRREGSFVGLEALVRPTYVESARVTTPAVLCRAPLETVDAWLGPRESPARMALEQTLRATCGDPPRAASADGNALQRVARWLLQEAGRSDQADVPRRYIAGLLGIVPETLSRNLGRLAAAGAIAVTRRHIRIVDLEALRAAASPP